MPRSQSSGERPKSAIAQFIQTAGAGVALVVASSTAIYTLYDKLIVQPGITRAKHHADFSEAVNRYSQISQQTQMQVSMALNDQIKAAVVANSVFPLLTSLSDAEQAASTPGFVATSDEYLQLAIDELASGRQQAAFANANRSLRAGAVDLAAANAHDVKAKALVNLKGLPGLAAARTEYQLALKSIAKLPPWGTSYSRAFYLTDWSNAEGIVGDCARFASLDKRVQVELAKPDQPTGSAAQFLANPLRTAAQRRCGRSESEADDSIPLKAPGTSTFLPPLAPPPVDPPKPVVATIETEAGTEVTIHDVLGKDQVYENVRIYVNHKEVAFLHVSADQPEDEARISVKLGDTYALGGRVRQLENGTSVARVITGSGRFHGQIAPSYRLKDGSRQSDTQTEYLDRID